MCEQAVVPVNLGAMACLNSCFATYLKMIGRNEKYFALKQWYLRYSSRTRLISPGSRVDFQYLRQSSGAQLRYREQTVDELNGLLEKGMAAIIKCFASKLEYFPSELMIFESRGFQHGVLVTGMDRQTARYSVVDPIIGYQGLMSRAQINKLALKGKGTLCFFTIAKREDGSWTPDRQRLFKTAVSANFRQSVHSLARNTGAVLRRFRTDLQRSAGWNKNERDDWLYQNNIMITSIVKSRQYIWSGFDELGVLEAAEKREGARRVMVIVKLWNYLNFLLVKYKSRPGHAEVLDRAAETLESIAAAERGIIGWLRGLL